MTRLHLLRRSLGQGRLVAVLLAVVAALAAAYAVAVPRHASIAVDAALGDAFSASTVQAREVGLSITPRPAAPPSDARQPGRGARPPFDQVDEDVRAVLGPDVEPLLADPSWAAQSDPLDLVRPDGAPVSLDTLRAVLRVQSGLDERVRWVSGTAPSEPTDESTLRGTGGRTVRVVPVALAAPTAKRWGLEVGDRLDLVPEGAPAAVAAEVTGTYEPLDPADGFWQVEPRLTGVAAIPTAEGGVIQEASLVASSEAYAAVSDSLWRVRPGTDLGAGSPALNHSWRYPFDPEALTAADVPALRSALVRLGGDARLRNSLPEPLRLTTGIGSILDRHGASVATTRVMTSFATAGVTALAVLVLALTALVGVSRRGEEVRMLRARGASVTLVAALLGTEVLLVVLPVAAVAVLVVQGVVGGATPAVAWSEVAVVLLVPVVTVVAGVALRVRVLDRPAPADADTTALVSRFRRVVAELAVVAVAVLAVTTVRSRGAAIAGGTTDWYAALAPTLVALAVSVLLVRVVPPTLRAAARRASRRSGLVGFVGLARAARASATAVLPVVTVVVGATVLGLLLATTTTVATQREVAAYQAVGADARVDAARLDPRDVEALAQRPGVRAVAPAYTDPHALVTSGTSSREVLLLGVDLQQYAEVVRGTPLETALPPRGSSGADLPAVTGPELGLGEGSVVVTSQVRVPVRTVASAPSLERAAAGRLLPVVLVPLDALRQVVPSAQPNTAFLGVDAAGARALAAAPVDSLTQGSLVADVVTVEGTAADIQGLALPRLVTVTYVAAAALAALLTLLAVLLVLAATHDERTTLVVRLRTLGLPRGAERALAWTEVLPVVTAAALAGGVVGALAPWLVADALDLAPLTGAVTRLTVEPRPLLAVVAAAVVVVLGALALLIDALAARRGPLADHLRRGATA